MRGEKNNANANEKERRRERGRERGRGRERERERRKLEGYRRYEKSVQQSMYFEIASCSTVRRDQAITMHMDYIDI